MNRIDYLKFAFEVLFYAGLVIVALNHIWDDE